ncbi:MAG TPA: hypothetical protein P5205_21315 [Candidatus Paceibacterota bacterium]|nr:hypothetical protein [Verrucomicrobiota bacterium]HSA12903.1 hypothetical protein [Candidatus Paceibacterota bacterium]
MKIAPFATEAEKFAWQRAKELELASQTGDRWRVDILPGRYGWAARAMRLCRNPQCNRPQAKGSKYCSQCGRQSRAHNPCPDAHGH